MFSGEREREREREREKEKERVSHDFLENVFEFHQLLREI